ncbi:MAG: aminoglycoside phosphotransferase family protein [Alphaproteobacteria bacterium]|nr:aminoglycoside phosphotransferase family protein [Alphaproteobacteria bacterium]
MTTPGEGQEAIRDMARSLLGAEPDSIRPVRGGGNNRIYRVDRGEATFALKFYPADERDRLGAEYRGLTFLVNHGVEEVPRPIAADSVRRAALYEWIDGQSPGVPTAADFERLFGFVATLIRLGSAQDAAGLPWASAACPRAADAYDQLEARLRRLRPHASAHPRLTDFLERTFLPGCERMTGWSRRMLAEAGTDVDTPLPRHRLYLSPSDFGLHNILRRPDGRIAHVDFEYFGWDDPVKAVSDFVLHPGSDFDPDTRIALLRRATRLFEPLDEAFTIRLEALLGIYALIWCLILLNEFVPETWSRRAQAGGVENRDEAQHRQLDKAERLYQWLWTVHDERTALEASSRSRTLRR